MNAGENYGSFFTVPKDFVCIERLINACLRRIRLCAHLPDDLRSESIFSTVNAFRRVFFISVFVIISRKGSRKVLQKYT